MSATAAEVIRDLLQQASDREADTGQLIAIIANLNIDTTQVEEWAAYCFNDSWMPTINGKLKEGFVTVRVQTEFQLNGHCAMIYMAKMKASVPPPDVEGGGQP